MFCFNSCVFSDRRQASSALLRHHINLQSWLSRYLLTNTAIRAQAAAATSSQARPGPPLASNDNGSALDGDEFLDPVTGALIVDPVIGSDGCTYDRCCPSLVAHPAWLRTMPS